MPRAQIRAWDAEILFELLNSHDQEFTLNHQVKTLQQNALEEAKEPEPEPNKRTMAVTMGLELTELGVSESKTLIRTSSVQQQVDNELREPLLAI
jgi:hypothetical protein